MKRPFDLWFSEQVEALAVAIAMALVLKFFVIEAYQIPSGSMQPTILGDRATGIKDRVIADKLITMLRPPQRWEVMIFRFPSDERRLYVKRIVGLPGETLEIAGGDIWIDGKVARKPDHVNASVLKTLFPEYDGGVDIGRVFVGAGPDIVVTGDRASFAPGADGELRLRQTVYARYDHGYDPAWGIAPSVDGPEAVSDLDITLDVRLDEGATGLTLRFSADDGERELFLPRRGAGLAARVVYRPGGGDEVVYLDDPGLSIPAGRDVEVLARHVDRQVLLQVDGDEWLRHDEDDLGPLPLRPMRARVALAVAGGGRVQDVVLRRDIFYTPRFVPDPRWEIPDDSYFAMGDNTQSSLDCRGFARRTYAVRGADGEVRSITGFAFEHLGPGPGPPDQNPRPLADGRLEFADIHGDTWAFAPGDIVPQGSQPYTEQPAPFIHRRYLLGKVLAVFWPVYDPFRWKLVR